MPLPLEPLPLGALPIGGCRAGTVVMVELEAALELLPIGGGRHVVHAAKFV